VILLWGVETDGAVRRVREELAALGAPSFFLDQRRMLATSMRLPLRESGGGALRVGDRTLDLSMVTSAYLRPYAWHRSPELEPHARDGREWRHAARLQQVIMCWCELTRARLVSPLGAPSLNGSKPLQAQRLRQLGFRVPATLVTTDPAAASAFAEAHPGPIYKSASGARSIVSRLGPERAAELRDVASCPTQLQEYIPGDDYRVHTVGKQVFTTRVTGGAIDYRYPAHSHATVQMEAAELPAAVAARCVAAAEALGLPLAGIDLRQTPDGDWCCFEVNPAPGFTFFEQQTHQPIAAAVARLLAAGPAA
jgi:hypothetical protein